MPKSCNAKWYHKEMENCDDTTTDMTETEEQAPEEECCDDIPCGEVPRLVVLAHSYVPWQCYNQAFSPCEALKKGTLFPELWGVYPIPK